VKQVEADKRRVRGYSPTETNTSSSHQPSVCLRSSAIGPESVIVLNNGKLTNGVEEEMNELLKENVLTNECWHVFGTSGGDLWN